MATPEKFLENAETIVKIALSADMIELDEEQTNCLIKAINALKMILTGNFTHGFDPEHWHLVKVMSEGELKNIEKQLQIQLGEVHKQWAMYNLIKLAELHPKIVFQHLSFQISELSTSERDNKLQEYRAILGSATVNDFLMLCKALKASKKKIVYLSCTFWGGGISPMLLAAIPLMRSLGVDIEWHSLWVSKSSFFRSCKSLHNRIQGISDEVEVDWEVYCKVNEENEKLYSILRDSEDTIFFYDDPQPYGMNPRRQDISVLHIDTTGTHSSRGNSEWEILSKFFGKAKVFLHQPGLSGSKTLPNALPLAPGIDILSPKNIPRTKEEATSNILKDTVRDDWGRVAFYNKTSTRWMYVARADPTKGQIPALLAFAKYLLKDSHSVMWFFLQYQVDDFPAHVQYVILKYLVEDDLKEKALLTDKIKRLLEATNEERGFENLLHIIEITHKKIHSGLPAGVSLKQHVQIFTNLSREIGDFATIATGHLVLSTREGYNLVINELACHNVPVIANDYPPFRDRIISGVKGGWFVQCPNTVYHSHQLEWLSNYVYGHPEMENYIQEICEKMELISLNLEMSRNVASALNDWINKEGHVLRYHMDRLSFVLASEKEIEGCKSASEVRAKVLSKLSQETPLFLSSKSAISIPPISLKAK